MARLRHYNFQLLAQIVNKLLVITYYWPPQGGVGVQRWLKFVKYLPDYGHMPTVFTAENPAFDLLDENLLKEIPDTVEVIRFPIWEPFTIFNKLNDTNKKNVQQGLVLEKKKRSWKDHLIIWIRGNFFIPDPRVFWVKPAARFLSSYIEQHDIKTIITTGPPHSIHLIGKRLKSKHDIKWLADFRDPWSNWDLLDKLKTTALVRRIHRKYERKVLQSADEVITVSANLARDLGNIGEREVTVIHNGVDIEAIKLDFDDASSVNKFRISYIGLLNELREPVCLWEALDELMAENDELANQLELNLAGIVSENILTKLQSNARLKKVLNFKSYIPHHQVFEELQKSAMLIVILNNSDNARWIIPGKMYEYMMARRKILLLGPPESDAGKILEHSNAGQAAGFDDKVRMKKIILETFRQYQLGNIVLQNVNYNQYSRKKLTSDLSQILNKD